MGWNLYCLHQFVVRAGSRENHTKLFKKGSEVVVEFISMSMALTDHLFSIEFSQKGAFLCLTWICTQSHGASLSYSPLVRHYIDDAFFSLRKELGGVGFLQANDISCKLYYSHLHSEADSQEWYVVYPCPSYSFDFTFHTSVSKAPWNQDSVYIRKDLLLAVLGHSLTVNPLDVDSGSFLPGGMLQCFHYR